MIDRSHPLPITRQAKAVGLPAAGRPEHRVYPYRLRRLDSHRPGQVYAMGITYLPMARGFVYLAAVMDGYSRKVLSWRVSITMDGKGPCLLQAGLA